jgi:hypothetical protein
VRWIALGRFHDLRHFFASQCSGRQTMTVRTGSGIRMANSGGQGLRHLADEHKRRMADNLSILKAPMNVLAPVPAG